MTLVELLLCMVIIGLLACLLATAVVRATRRAKATAWAAYSLHNARLATAGEDDAAFQLLSTTRLAPWSFIELRGSNVCVWR